MSMSINRRLLLLALGAFGLFIGWMAVTSQGAGAAAGGTIDSDDRLFVQGTVDDQDRPVYLATETFQGSITQCLDSYCRNSTTSVVPGLFRGEGFAVADSGRVAIIGEVEDDNFNLTDSIIVCSDSSCSDVVSTSPAPAVGSLHALPNESMLIVNDRTVTSCRDLACGLGLTFDHGIANVRDATVVGRDLIFLTDDSIVRCGTGFCRNDRTATPHGIAGAEDISIGSDGLPRISVRVAANDGVDFTPELHRCLDANCNQVDVEVLGFTQNGRSSLDLIDGDPTRAVVSNTVTSNVDSQLLVSTPLRCNATVSGNNISVSFDGDAGRATILRLDGRFVETVTGQDQASATFSGSFPQAVIRTWFGDIFIDVPCLEGAADGGDQPGGGGDDPTTGGDPTGSVCTVDRSDAVTIRYEAGSSVSLNLRGDDGWIATLSTGQTSFVDADASESYTLVRRDADGVRTDQTCTEGAGDGGNTGAVTCTISQSGTNVSVSWDNVGDGTVVLRKDGRWLATPNGDDFTDADGSLDSSYLLRLHRADGSGFDDTACQR